VNFYKDNTNNGKKQPIDKNVNKELMAQKRKNNFSKIEKRT